MSLLIIDRDEHSVNEIAKMLDEQNIAYKHVLTRDQGMEALRQKPYDVVILDPAPQNEIRPFVMAARRMAKAYPYILMTSRTIDKKAAMSGGCNNLMPKPLDLSRMGDNISSALRLGKMIVKLADESEDFPSKNGVIAKSAFNQLFLSCLDRADRYGEQSYIIYVRITNFNEIITKEGGEKLNEISLNLRNYLSRIRRLSDICGQTSRHEFALLLLRPSKDDEPFLAANRFAETLQEYHDLISTGQTNAEIAVSLFTVPSGEVLVEHSFNDKSDPV
jgi:GGDEF domain-containing protein